MTNDQVWNKLRSADLLTSEQELFEPVDSYKTVVRYLTVEQLEGVMNNSWRNGNAHMMSYTPGYKKAAEHELTERLLLKKKKLRMPK